jgi:hypothetical protein
MIMIFFKSIPLERVRQIQLVNGMKGLVNGGSAKPYSREFPHWPVENSGLT